MRTDTITKILSKCIAATLLLYGLQIAIALPDDHQITIPYDSDGDLLSDNEELRIVYDPDNPDENSNSILDGVDLATELTLTIDLLPVYSGTGDPPTLNYKIEHLLGETETCEICSESMDTGYWEIFNPGLVLTMNVPFMAQHFMTHGTFSYNGTKSDSRVDIVTLSRILGVAPSAVKNTRWQVYR